MFDAARGRREPAVARQGFKPGDAAQGTPFRVRRDGDDDPFVLAVGPDDVVLGISSLSFDMSAYDIFGTLAAGGTTVIVEGEARLDPARWEVLVCSLISPGGDDGAVAEDLTAREIMERVEDRDEGNPSIVDVAMTLIDKSGKKRLREIRAVEEGRADRENNPLRRAPHTAEALIAEEPLILPTVETGLRAGFDRLVDRLGLRRPVQHLPDQPSRVHPVDVLGHRPHGAGQSQPRSSAACASNVRTTVSIFSGPYSMSPSGVSR